METLKYALTLVSQNCFFCFLDLHDAYFSVHMALAAQNLLKFVWKGQLYKFTAFPNGLASCPRLFTKLLKPAMAHLNKFEFISTIFFDDTLLIASSELECIRNVKASLQLPERLGFALHPVKSVLNPSHSVTYLGFILNSVDMSITLTDEKKSEDSKLCFSVVEGGCLFCAYVSKVFWTSCGQFSWCHVWIFVASRSGERQNARAWARTNSLYCYQRRLK